MRGRANPELRETCLKLRVENRLSHKEIHAETGAPVGSISTWLRDYPLTPEERRRKEDAGRLRLATSRRKPRGEESFFYRLAPKPLDALRKSRVAEAAVLFRLSLFGIRAFKPAFDGDKVDWLAISSDGACAKIQVRATKPNAHGLPMVSLRCANGRKSLRPFRDGEVDFVVGYDLRTDRAYVWSWDEVRKTRNMITISPDAEERWDKISRGSLSGRAPS